MLGGVVPVDVAQLPGKLGSGLEDFGSLDEGALDAEFGIALDEAFDGLGHQLGSHGHEPVVDVAGIVGIFDAAFLAEDDASGIDVVVYHECGHSRHPLTVDDRPVDGRGAAILRQQRRMEVEGAELRHRPDFLRKHAEGHDHEEVGLPCPEGVQELRILQLDRLKYRNPVLHGVFLHRTLVHLEPASGGLVRYGHHADHLVALGNQGLKRCDGELRGTHVYYARLPEESRDLGLHQPPGVLDSVGAEGAVVGCFPYEVHRDGDQHVQRDEGSAGRRHRAVFGELLARQVHDPVQHEEQDGDDGGGAQTSLAYERPERGSEEEEDEACQRLDETP